MSQDEDKKEEFVLQTKADFFANYSLEALTNEKIFPVKYKRITDRLQDYALDVPWLIQEGNYFKETRYTSGRKAIMVLTRFLKLLEMLYRLDSNFGKKKMNYWKGLACEIKRMTQAWIKPYQK